MVVITISRQYGSGGDEIAALVCKMLGYRHFDKRLMAQMAAEVGLDEHEVVDFSEDNYKMQGFLDRLLGRRLAPRAAQADPLQVAIAGPKVNEVERMDEEYTLTLIQSTIHAAYEQGNVVIVGRGGQAILKDKPDVLHVRIEAPYNARVDRLCQRENFSLAGAKDTAIKHDRKSAEYLKRFYAIDWADTLPYDLVINTGKLNTDAASHLIVNSVSYLPPAEG